MEIFWFMWICAGFDNIMRSCCVSIKIRCVSACACFMFYRKITPSPITILQMFVREYFGAVANTGLKMTLLPAVALTLEPQWSGGQRSM